MIRRLHIGFLWLICTILIHRTSTKEPNLHFCSFIDEDEDEAKIETESSNDEEDLPLKHPLMGLILGLILLTIMGFSTEYGTFSLSAL